MCYDSICIFCPTGRTFTFKHCVVDCDNETVLHFSYIAMSDTNTKYMTVLKSNIIGYSVKKEDPGPARN